jgi:hypothetical protein
MRRLSFPERLERIMIVALIAAIVLVAQRYSMQLYRWGLLLLVGATLLQIAVGNLPKDAGVGRSLLVILAILAFIPCEIGVGIALTPFLSQLGR